MSALGVAGSGSMMLLRSRTFWIIVILIIVAIIIWRYSDRFIEKAESRLGKQYGDWQEGTITDGRKKQLEDLAQRLYNEIYSFFQAGEGGTVAALNQAGALNDNELLYMARYYEDAITKGNSLYQDIDDEWLWETSADENVMNRLSQLGMK